MRPGDTLSGIARRTGRDLQTLIRRNGLVAPYTIYPGQSIRLGEATATTGPAPAVTKRAQRSVHAAPSRLSPIRIWPVHGPILRAYAERGHQGITIGTVEGQPVLAAADGKVIYAGNELRGYRHLVIVQHPDDYLTTYGYNRRLLVREGMQVQAGQVLAEAGRNARGMPAVHFGIRRGGRPVDPLLYLPAGPVAAP